MRKKLRVTIKMDVLARTAPPCEICLQPTSISRYTNTGERKTGQFAHIRAVSNNGPRYDSTYPQEKLDSPDNLFWSCKDCHDIVDNDESWTLEVLMSKLGETRSNPRSRVELIIEGEINVSGENADSITGIDAGGKQTVLKRGTVVNVSGKDVKNIIGVKN